MVLRNYVPVVVPLFNLFSPLPVRVTRHRVYSDILFGVKVVDAGVGGGAWNNKVFTEIVAGIVWLFEWRICVSCSVLFVAVDVISVHVWWKASGGMY